MLWLVIPSSIATHLMRVKKNNQTPLIPPDGLHTSLNKKVHHPKMDDTTGFSKQILMVSKTNQARSY